MLVTLKNYIYEVDKINENGDVIIKDQSGELIFMGEKAFKENYIPIKKVERTRTKRKSPFELAAITEGYSTMGELVKQSNEEDQNYIFEVK